jgi:hypothetical protein
MSSFVVQYAEGCSGADPVNSKLKNLLIIIDPSRGRLTN